MSIEESVSQRFSPNNVLVNRRTEKGWSSRARAAREIRMIGLTRGLPVPDIESVTKALYRHETGQAAVKDPLYIELYCLAYEATPHELFGEIKPPKATGNKFSLRSHKFVPVYVGCDDAAILSKEVGAATATKQWINCEVAKVEKDLTECHLYVWPFGVAMLHLVEEITLPNIANLAFWRRASYKEILAWMPSFLDKLVPGISVHQPYAFNVFWLNTAAWDDLELETALRLMCMPRTLMERQPDNSSSAMGHAELVEKSLLSSGFTHPDFVPFGVKGISIAYAAWSGVVYHPLAPQRALTEDQIVSCELAVQAIWSYCDYIRAEVEEGRDPDISAKYGWRFLRGARSRLMAPRPHEAGQHRSMREAVLETSALPAHMAQAAEILRETHGGIA